MSSEFPKAGNAKTEAASIFIDEDALVINSRRIPLSDSAEIYRFLNEEVAFWQSVNLKSGYHSYDQVPVLTKLNSFHERVRYFVDDAPVSVHWAEELVSFFASDGLPLSWSPKAVFIKNLSERKPQLGRCALQYFTNARHTSEASADAAEAVTLSVLFEHGIRGNTRSEKAALKRLREQWEAGLEEVKADHQTLHEELEKQNGALVTRFEGLEKQVSGFLDNLRDEISEHQNLREAIGKRYEGEISEYHEKGNASIGEMHNSISEAKEELDRLKATYNQQMALKAPVQYLIENSDTHRTSARGYLQLIWVAVPVALIVLGTIGWFLLASRDKPPIGNMILFFMFAGLIVWFLRILARLYLSHKHLEVDAKERIVAAKTYLALIAEGVEPREAERTIIMGTLFRPASIGIMDDDSVPTSSVDVVSRLLKGDK